VGETDSESCRKAGKGEGGNKGFVP
jgi:hypothetical protein